MKANILLKKILMELAAKKHKFAQMTLENGTILEAEVFEAGNEVFIVTDEERIPVPVGDYVLSDGRAMKVEEEGIIAMVEGGAEVVAEDMPKEDIKVEAEDSEVVVEIPEEVAEEVKSVVEAVIAAVAPLIEEVKAEMAQIKEEMKKYKKMSSQTSTRTIKHNPTTKPVVNNVTMSENRSRTTTIDRVLARLSR